MQMLKNLKMGLATELTELTKEFRTEQQEYLKGLQRLKEKRKELTHFEDHPLELNAQEQKRIEELEQEYAQQYSEEQVRELIENQKDIIRRDQELREILNDIVELQALFNQFQGLVVEQGTLLDRIDYNVESAQVSMKGAVKNLVDAEDAQKNSAFTCCVLVLGAIIIVACFILFLKFS
jgi:syntaxin 16